MNIFRIWSFIIFLINLIDLITLRDYMNKMAENINEMLHEKGSVSLTELTNLYELPSDFINQVISRFAISFI